MTDQKQNNKKAKKRKEKKKKWLISHKPDSNYKLTTPVKIALKWR